MIERRLAADCEKTEEKMKTILVKSKIKNKNACNTSQGANSVAVGLSIFGYRIKKIYQVLT